MAAVYLFEECALAGVALAHHLAQLMGPEPSGKRSQPAASLDAGELSGVADRDDLDPCRGGVRKHPGRLASAGHTGLVEDQHGRPRPETGRVGVEIERQPRQRPRLRDAGVLPKLTDGASGRRGPQHTEAAGVIGAGKEAGGDGLARPGQRLNAVDAVAAGGQPADHGCLLGRGREGRSSEDRVDKATREPPTTFAAACLCASDDRFLVGNEIARREAHLARVACAVHVRAAEELGGGTLDDRCRRALAVRGRPRHDRLASSERVLSLGQPGRASELVADELCVWALRLSRRPAHQRAELPGTEPVLGRAGAHDLLPWRGVDPVALALAGVVCDRLAARPAHLDARSDQLALALLDLAPARGELPHHLGSNLLDLGHALVHRPPPHPRQALADRRAQVRLVQEARRLGVLVDRRGIKRRPATVDAARHVRRDHMGVQLRILGAAHAMAIRRRHEPLPRLAPHPAAAASNPTRLTLEIAQGSANRERPRECATVGLLHGQRHEECEHDDGERPQRELPHHLAGAERQTEEHRRAKVEAPPDENPRSERTSRGSRRRGRWAPG